MAQTKIRQQQTVLASPVGGRLTLTSGTPVTTSDVTGATTLYFTPYNGNKIDLYNGTSWNSYTFSELSLSLSGYAINTNFDIFIYDNSGTLTLESLAWTDATNRAVALVLQNGIYVKSGATTRRYIGTIRTTTVTGQTEDSQVKRFVWNYYNQILRNFYFIDATASWSYAVNAFRQSNANTANKAEFVTGMGAVMDARFYEHALNTATGTGAIAIGLDSITTPSSVYSNFNAYGPLNADSAMYALFNGPVTLGYHYMACLEKAAVTAITFYGTASFFAFEGSILA